MSTAPDDPYKVMVFRPGDEEEFDLLFAENGIAPADPTQLRRKWWSFANPAGGAFFVVMSGREIAATSYLGGKAVCLAGKTQRGYEIGETATKPAHQRKGLFSRLVTASEAHCAEREELIYGTPNGQSTPGYAKLGFEILESPESWLFLVPNWRRILPWPRPRHAVRELSFAEYCDATQTFPRLNAVDRAYLEWRFANAPMAYRYFVVTRRGTSWHIALRLGALGKHPVLIASECFANGAKASVFESASAVRRAAAFGYGRSTYTAIQLHCAWPRAKGKFILGTRGIAAHRVLPICTVPPGRGSAAEWFERFQLSDCDIG